MPSWKALVLSLSAASILNISSASVTPSFDDLLDSLPEKSLQQALGSGSPGSEHKYDGGERAALQALHDQDPDTASKVLAMVHLGLAKRQLPSIGVSAGVSVPNVLSAIPVSLSVPSVALPTTAAQTSSVPLPSSTPTPAPSPSSLPSSFPPPRESLSQSSPPSSAPAPTSSFPGSSTLASSSYSGPAPGFSVTSSSAGSAATSSVPQSTSNVPSSVESTSQPQTSAAAISPTAASSTSVAPVIVPVPQTSIDAGQTTVNTGFATVQPTRSTVIGGTSFPVVGVTATNTQGQTVTSDQPLGIPPGSGPGAGGNSGGNDVTTTDQYGNTVVLPNATPGAVITATDANGRVITTTYHPGVTRSVKSTVVLSSTLSGGQNTLVTLTAYVVPDAVTGAAGADAGGSKTQGTAGLQTGNAADNTRHVGAEALALAVGVAGVAFAL